ncbi:hypothetical protein [Sporosarcina sp. FSL W7-1283]|uniref:hypothetical protein n=1 Tax=Sporosarcina sp. FSL W7-1283 TaxID=2921560 RepID=UPI0030FACE34
MDPMFSAQKLLEYGERIKSLWAMLPTFIDEYEIHARLKREKFNALTKEGFTESQAMEIIVAGQTDMSL